MSSFVWPALAVTLLLATPAAGQTASPPTAPATALASTLDLAFEPSGLRAANGELHRMAPRLAVPGDGPVDFVITFDRDGDALSTPRHVHWSMRLNEALPVAEGYLQAVVTGPSGERWVGREERLSRRRETGPILARGTVSTSDGDSTLLVAVAQGGRFVLTLEDWRGRVWDQTAIEVPPADAWQGLEDAERGRFLALDPDTLPRPPAGPPRVHMPLTLPSMKAPGPGGTPELEVGQYASLMLNVGFEADGDTVGAVTFTRLSMRRTDGVEAATDGPPFVLTGPDGQTWNGDTGWLEACDGCSWAQYDLTRSPDWAAIKAALESGGNFHVRWGSGRIALSTGRPAGRNELWARSRARAAALAAG